jgi:PmbA protein
MDLKPLKEKYNLKDLEVFSQDTLDYRVTFSANNLKQADLTQRNGYAVRLIDNKKLGFASAFGDSNIEELVKKAKNLSKYSPDLEIEFPSNKKKDTKTGSNQQSDANPENNLEDFKNKGLEVIDSILKKAPGVLVDISFDFSQLKEEITNSNDLSYSQRSSTYSFSASIKETNENDFIEVFTASIDTKLPEYEGYILELLNLYNLSKKQAKIKNGKYPVLFTSKAAKELFGFVEDAINGKMIVEKSSPWGEKLNKQILSKNLTIKQDPRFGYMAKDFDDEGVEIKSMNFIKDGVLENFYFDLITASRYVGSQAPLSTGNGFRPSLGSQVNPSILNMIVTPGNKSLDEIIKSIDYGLLVDQTMGGLSANISGDMSVNIDTGFLIEKGEVIGRVKNTMITGNVYNVLNNVIDLSNSPKWYWSNIYNPDVLVEGFSITSEA